MATEFFISSDGNHCDLMRKIRMLCGGDNLTNDNRLRIFLGAEWVGVKSLTSKITPEILSLHPLKHLANSICKKNMKILRLKPSKSLQSFYTKSFLFTFKEHLSSISREDLILALNGN